MSARDIQRILGVSRLFNTLSDVTGILIHRNGTFFQVLEGAPEALERTYARILRDRRHRDCQLLLNETIAERQFGDWQMAYRDYSNAFSCVDLSQLDMRALVKEVELLPLCDHAALEVFLTGYLRQAEAVRFS